MVIALVLLLRRATPIPDTETGTGIISQTVGATLPLSTAVPMLPALVLRRAGTEPDAHPVLAYIAQEYVSNQELTLILKPSPFNLFSRSSVYTSCRYRKGRGRCAESFLLR